MPSFGARSSRVAAANTEAIAISGNSRYLTKGGRPWFVVGDTAWSLCCLSTANATTYLDSRAGLGFNAIILNAMEAYFWPTAPANANGDSPFVGTAFQSAPNAAYWNHLASIIALMAARKLVAFVSPVYSGFGEGSEGWASAINAATDAQMTEFGRFCGGRLGGFDNLVWTIGGDANPSATHQSRLTAFTQGLLAADQRHLVTAHWAPESQAGDYPGVVNVKIDTCYSYSTTLYNEASAVYGNTPIKPALMWESAYENEHSSTGQSLRAQAYWSVLSGTCGQFLGNNPIWFFGTAGDGNPGHTFSDSSASWATSLNSVGAQSMGRLASIFAGKPWHLLAPDSSNTAITAGKSSGTSYATAARATDGSLIMAYVPTQRQVTIALGQINAANARITWHDGSSSASTSNTVTASGSRNETSPYSGDSILVVEAA